jgi:class 3 adenylate cyclase
VAGVELNDRYVLLEECLAGRRKAMDRRYGGPVAVERRVIRSAEQGTALMHRLGRLLELSPHPSLPVLRDEFRIGDEHWLVSNWVDGVVATIGADPVSGGPANGGLGDGPIGAGPVGAGPDGDPGHAAAVLARLAAIAEALGHLHQQDDVLVHGALTPQAIILRPGNRIMLTGLCGPLDDDPADRHLAPEVRAGQPAGVASDVYGLAALAWLWLTGQTPGGPMPALLASSRETAVLEHLLRSGLAENPADRPSSPSALVHRLDHRFRSTLPVGTVTFLMTDVCRSTELWQADPAAMAAAIDRHDRICAEAVELFNGVFPRDQGEGDSVLAAFSRASDALGCAEAIQRRLTAADERPPDGPQPARLQVRMALHTGEAGVRNGNYRCIAVNACARLRALAQGNQVLLSPVTAEIVRTGLPPGTELLDLGSYQLKDLNEPQRVFQLLIPGIDPGRPPARTPQRTGPAAGSSTPLLGRGPELAALFAAMDSALDGRPRTVLLLGEPGTGKTRLAQELVQHVAARDVRVIWGRCSEPNGTPDYWPWRQVMRAFAEEEDTGRLIVQLGSGRDDLCAAFPELAEALGVPGPELPADPQERRFRVAQAFLAFLRRAGADRPVLLLLDDLHWADQPSLLLLEFLSQHLSRAHLLIVAGFAESAATATAGDGSALGPRLRAIARQPITGSLQLRCLTRAEVAQFVATETASAAGSDTDTVVDAVYAASQGNPAAVKEIVDLLAAEPEPPPGADRDGKAGPVALARGIRTVIRRRLSARSDKCTQLLSVAAVIGTDFPIALAAAVAGLCSGDALSALDEAMAGGLVAPSEDPPGGRFSFSHSLIRQCVDDGLGQTERTRLHLAVAEVLEQSVVLDVEQRGRLAHHLLAATPWSDLTKAIRWARVAADDLAGREAHEECAQLYRAAVDAVRATPGDHGDVQYDLQLSEAEAWWKAGRPDLCTQALRLLTRANLMVRPVGTEDDEDLDGGEPERDREIPDGADFSVASATPDECRTEQPHPAGTEILKLQ